MTKLIKDQPLPKISRRIQSVIDRHFEGNVAAAARELNIPYLSIIRTLRGSDPGTRLLAALVEHLGVDARWLLTGPTVTLK